MPKHATNKPLIAAIVAVLKKLRDETPQWEVSDQTKVHIGRLESRNNFTIVTLERICQYFKISKSDFFKLVEEYERANPPAPEDLPQS